jgi:hypothetical protein
VSAALVIAQPLLTLRPKTPSLSRLGLPAIGLLEVISFRRMRQRRFRCQTNLELLDISIDTLVE